MGKRIVASLQTITSTFLMFTEVAVMIKGHFPGKKSKLLELDVQSTKMLFCTTGKHITVRNDKHL